MALSSLLVPMTSNSWLASGPLLCLAIKNVWWQIRIAILDGLVADFTEQETSLEPAEHVALGEWVVLVICQHLIVHSLAHCVLIIANTFPY